jgi:NADPH-dependent curcumin reductase
LIPKDIRNSTIKIKMCGKSNEELISGNEFWLLLAGSRNRKDHANGQRPRANGRVSRIYYSFNFFLIERSVLIMNLINHQFRLAARPVGLPKRSDWNYVEEPVRDPGPGEVLVKTLYLSLDPAMRGWMNEGRSYVPPVGIGEVMRAGGAGEVIASGNPAFAVGDHVTGMLGAQEYALVKADAARGLIKVDPKLVPLPVYVGALGVTGLTAYFGLLDVGQAKAGDTVVVSGAAGATGMVAGQIAKIKGCRAVGIAGGPEKCNYIVKELGFDAAIDYKNEDVFQALRTHCPQGINVYFDNVGGDILDAALANIARGARVVLCGAISQYNSTTGIKGPSNYLSLLVNSARMEGFIVFNYLSRYGEAAREMAGWMMAGKLKSREDIVEGFRNFPETLLKLFRGENLGKLMIKVADA